MHLEAYTHSQHTRQANLHVDTLSTSGLGHLKSRCRAGDPEALPELIRAAYGELRVMAAHYLRKERRDHTWQTTELLHEACQRILDCDAKIVISDRSHFFRLAARTIRRTLVDYARSRQCVKREGDRYRVELTEFHSPSVGPLNHPEILSVHEALEVLKKYRPRQAELVELRYFGDLTHEQAAEVLGISPATAYREWKVARQWLHHRLSQ